MASSLTAPSPAVVREQAAAHTSTATIPWYIWCAVFAVTSAMIGGHWDISWHRSIGRDTFWTPAHIAIYLCGVVGGLTCAYLILSRTFGAVKDEATVAMWGFRAPLGAFLVAWGGVAMLTSAPFDDWWHNAYGLDVKIVSPPHALLILGVAMVITGALILTLGHMNRAQGPVKSRLNAIFLYIGAMLIVLVMVFLMELTGRIQMHTAAFYQRIAVAVPVVLAGLARASGLRWAATITTGIYSLFLILCILILPLFPAEPKLGPVYYPVTHFVPPDFPLLLIVPAVLLDLLWRKTEGWSSWLLAVVSGVVFVGAFVAVQWPFANFLMSDGARNAFFGAHYFGYYTHPQSYLFRRVFLPTEPHFIQGMALALAFAIVSMRAGFAWGNWMRLIRR
ncbi:MAG: hypothetical protein NZV14_00940 [Bryobacteraceae bacterium]|nr:hypothetical protein [Bryobacteraceae bacterium]MDW8376695.1 hypothetical protein [Bryobacterales bacterium]